MQPPAHNAHHQPPLAKPITKPPAKCHSLLLAVSQPQAANAHFFTNKNIFFIFLLFFVIKVLRVLKVLKVSPKALYSFSQ